MAQLVRIHEADNVNHLVYVSEMKNPIVFLNRESLGSLHPACEWKVNIGFTRIRQVQAQKSQSDLLQNQFLAVLPFAVGKHQHINAFADKSQIYVKIGQGTGQGTCINLLPAYVQHFEADVG